MVGPRLKLHPIAVLVAVLVGGTIGGIAGAFLAVPFATVFAVLDLREEAPHVDRVLHPATGRRTDARLSAQRR